MRTILILFLTNVLFLTYSQNEGARPRGNFDPSRMPREGILKGRVFESTIHKPMEFVTLALYNSRDSSLVTGTVTDTAGNFEIRESPYGKFFLTITFIGYEKKTIRDILITPNNKMVDLGEIDLKSSATALGEVEITGDKPRVQYSLDKKIVNVSQDIKSAGGTAIDVLENVPSVKVDIEGNVTLRGSSSFTVLIDGRPTVLEGSDALQQIPAASIDRIEIITNPSAKYDPEGTAGIINVVMKKQTQKGLNGVVNASIGTKNKYSGNALLNYRIKKFNVFGGIDYGNRDFSGKGTSTNETFYGDTTNYRLTNSENTFNRTSYGIKAGTDFFLDNNNTFSLSGKYGYYGFGNSSTSNIHLYTAPMTADSFLISTYNSKRNGNYYELTSNFQHNFKQKGEKLEAMIYFERTLGKDGESLLEYPSNSEWINLNQITSQIQTNETNNSSELEIKADYTKPMDKKGTIEAGYEGRMDYENENYKFLQYDTTMSEWIQNETYTNSYDFQRNIQAAYLTYSNEWKGFGFLLGLRGEYTYRYIKNVNSPESYLVDRFDYFPSIHLSKTWLENNQILVSYSRRINRVHGWNLDPFVMFIDPYNARQGNPNLQDEFVDSYDLGYQYKFNTSFIALEGYYRITNNKITSIKTLEDNGVILTTFDNLSKDYSLGSNLSGNIDVTKWLNVFASGDIFQYRLVGPVEGRQVDTTSINWEAQLNLTTKFKYDIRVQLSSSYDGPTVTAQGSQKGHFMSSLAVRKDFFDRKLSLTFSSRDIFRTATRESTTSGEGFYQHDYFQREAPIFMLTVSYKINNYKKSNLQLPDDQQQNNQEEDYGNGGAGAN